VSTARAPRRTAAARPSPRPVPRRGAAERRPPALRVVTDERPSNVRIGLVGTVVLTLVFGSMLGLAAFHSVLVQGQLQLDRVNRAIQQEEAAERELRLEAGRLAAPERILLAAEANGMVRPDDRKYLAAIVPGSVVPPPTTAPVAVARKAAR
jgi:cell division protein FtsL